MRASKILKIDDLTKLLFVKTKRFGKNGCSYNTHLIFVTYHVYDSPTFKPTIIILNPKLLCFDGKGNITLSIPDEND